MNAPASSSAELTERVAHLRKTEFPWCSGTTYFNNASIGPLPERTRVVVDQLVAEKMTPYSIDDRELFAGLADTRSTIARLINADVDEIGLTTSTTLGLNIAAQALPVESGEIVLLPDREFPANVYPWKRLESRGVGVELAPPTAEGWPDEDYLCDRVTDAEVRVLAISLVQFSNGYRANIARLGEACRSNDCYLVVDGIQGIGQTAFDVSATPVDMVACGGQKWLLSPVGSGFVYVRKGLLERLEPTFVGWLAFEGTDDFTRLTEYEYELRNNARRFEVNTLPFQDLLGMNESVKLLLEFGKPEIEAWLRAVREPLVDAARAGRLRLVSPVENENSSGIVCVAPTKLSECHQQLKEEVVTVALREGALRLSPHCYNTPDEMEKVVAILTEYA